MALLGVLSLLGFSTRRSLAWLTGLVGAAAFCALPLGIVALAQPANLEDGRQLAYLLATLYAPVLLCLTGLRDYMAVQAQMLAAHG